MNKFAQWVKDNDKKQQGIAEKIGISQAFLHLILRKDQIPSLKIAYEIEKYTKGEITLYDWIDHENDKKTVNNTLESAIKFKEKRSK